MSLTFVIVARCGIAANYNLLYIQHLKMFPTLFLVTSLGIANFVCRIGVSIAPMVAEMKDPIPMILFTVLTFLTAIASLFLREH